MTQSYGFYNTNITKFDSIFFIYKAIKPKTKHSNTSMTSRFALANATRKGHIRHQNHMGLIAEENSDGSRRAIMTKRNHNSASVSREESDAAFTTILNNIYC
uniref:Uncharacterized protein n=1 Tax=Rhizophagus irregularis (strain DAOM 181602 / DAOM 197198 / MUCL 43194) TaxID=747089 RepID=U9UQP8_RHIID